MKDMRPIANHKTLCAEMAPGGWKYTGFDDGFYLFQSGSQGKGFLEMRCLESDLTPENLQLMARLGVSR